MRRLSLVVIGWAAYLFPFVLLFVPMIVLTAVAFELASWWWALLCFVAMWCQLALLRFMWFGGIQHGRKEQR